jgi:serine/threonine protein kinase
MIETGRFLQQRYRIDKQIGQGGMGAVYVATDERFGSTVAIKETLCMDDNFRKAIEREARLLNSLKHTALPRVSDHFEEQDSQFLVMEYIPGDDVAAMIESDHLAFPTDRVLEWADQLLDALDYLHRQDIPVIHRDIKPQNLKINSQGEMILLDFGLAKGNPSDASHQTAAKSIFGYSRNYASLEQIQGTGTDPRSDLYSLAATLYHLLTRIPPEDALTRAMSVLGRKPDPLVPANILNPEVPPGVAGVLQKALDLNADDRPSSAVEMRQMLRESENYAHLAVASGPLEIPDPDFHTRATKLMSDETRAGVIKPTGVRTAVVPGHSSIETEVDPAAAASVTKATLTHHASIATNKGRRSLLAGGFAAVLLVAVAAGAGLYVFKPSVFGVDKSASSFDQNATAPASVDPDPGSKADANSAVLMTDGPSENTNSSASNSEPIRQTTLADRPADTTKDKKLTGAGKANNQSETGDTMEVTSDDPDIPPGGVVITKRDENGRPFTLRVNPARTPPRVPQDGSEPLPPGLYPENLTPAQRKHSKHVIRIVPRPPITNSQPPPN